MHIRTYEAVIVVCVCSGTPKIDFKVPRTPLESLKAVFLLNYSGNYLSGP